MDKEYPQGDATNKPKNEKISTMDKVQKRQAGIYLLLTIIILATITYSTLLLRQNSILKKQLQQKESLTASNTNNPNTQVDKITSPTPAIGYIAKNTEQYTTRDLQFKLPEGWWFNMTTNIYFGDNWTEIDPQFKDNSKPTFILKAVSGKFQPTFSYKDYLKKTDTESIFVSGIKGELLIGIATPPLSSDVTCPECFLSGYKSNQRIAIAFIKKGNNYYTLEGSIDNYENAYRQILSTFNFVE